MSRRLPVCAKCGARLRGAQVRIQFGDLPGAPEIGWHADTEGVDRRRDGLLRCAWEDPLFDALMQSRNARSSSDTVQRVREIHARGAARVSGTKAWAAAVRE